MTTAGPNREHRTPAPRVTARGAGAAAVVDPVGLAVLTRRDLTAAGPVAFHTIAAFTPH